MYFKRFLDETTGDPLTDAWGTSTFYFETDGMGEVFRQVIVYENGRVLKYDYDMQEDEYGGLADQALDIDEFEEFEVKKEVFEAVWK